MIAEKWSATACTTAEPPAAKGTAAPNHASHDSESSAGALQTPGYPPPSADTSTRSRGGLSAGPCPPGASSPPPAVELPCLGTRSGVPIMARGVPGSGVAAPRSRPAGTRADTHDQHRRHGGYKVRTCARPCPVPWQAMRAAPVGSVDALESVTSTSASTVGANRTFWTLDDVSLTVQRATTMGPAIESGWGKSKIRIRVVLGLVPVTSRAMRWDGKDLTRLTLCGGVSSATDCGWRSRTPRVHSTSPACRDVWGRRPQPEAPPRYPHGCSEKAAPANVRRAA